MSDKITLWQLLQYMRADTLARMSADLDEETGEEADKLAAAVWDALVASAGDVDTALFMMDKEINR